MSTNRKIELDKIDLRILERLQSNARLTIKELAAQLELTTTPVYERIKRLERDGVIEKYVALINESALNKNLTALVQISLDHHSKEAVESFTQKMLDYEEVMECYHVTGDFDFHLKVVVGDMRAYNTFILEKLSVVKNLDHVKSMFVLSKRKYTTAFQI